eukprot:gnl/MRDRNA2_/MRDRNA2_138809_c0_seq1.p1 gnl/MRDRNA2_/MRDRNA2_138809_c0~~gnl/MRDRNA2_/MRDRNA2_138809_c0_seq1.p1  ORF type:complete len:1272 (+),score=182.75 gnl/MRDRNA2_/MRDRNA2_138809_c0_seq1:49-3864(+)
MDRTPLKQGSHHIAKTSLCCSPRNLRKRLNLKTRHQSKWDYEIIHKPPPRWRAEMLRAVNSIGYQAGIVLFIIFDLGLTIHDLTVNATADNEVLNLLNAIVLVVLSLDLVFRLAAEGMPFFAQKLNWFETAIVVICLIFYFVETEVPISLGRTLRPIFRVIKVVRLLGKAALGRQRVGERFDRLVEGMVDSMRERLLGDVLLVPQKNLSVDAREGFLRLEKVQLIPDAFQGLHLPFEIKGGFVELIHIDLNRRQRDQGVCIVVKNMLLVVGPGHHQETPMPPWTYESVLKAKGRLLEFISRRTEAFFAKDEGSETATSDVKNLSVGARLAARFKGEVIAALRSQVHVDINNIKVQYEDPRAELHNAPVSCGFKLGHLKAALVSKGQAQDSTMNSEFRALGCRRLTEISPELYHEAAKNAVRVEVALSRVSMWWNVKPVSLMYSTLVQDRQEIAKAIQHHKRSDVRERLCAAVVHVMHERPLCPGLEDRSDNPASRKLRQALAAHRYILHPAAISVHMLLREQPTDINEFVNTDVDISVKNVHVETEMQQVVSIRKMLAYMKKWTRDDRNFQWHPTCSSPFACQRTQNNNGNSIEQAEVRHGIVRARWLFALQGVLRAIDPVHPWQILIWLEVRRKANLKKQYIDLLLHRLRCARAEAFKRQHRSILSQARSTQETWDEEKERSLEEIQVAIPLSDLLSYRQTARQLDAVHARESEEGHSLKAVLGHETRLSASNISLSSNNDVIIDIPSCAAETQEAGMYTHAKHDSWPKTLLLGVSQLHFHLEQVTAVVLDAPDMSLSHSHMGHDMFLEESNWKTAIQSWLRRPLLEFRLAHSKVMLCVNPSHEADVPHTDDFDTAHSALAHLEASIGSLQALYCCAPTSCPVLRHIIRRAPGYLHEESAPLVQVSIRRTYDEVHGSTQSAVKLEIPAVSLALYSPLLTQLSIDFHNHDQRELHDHNAESDESFRHSVLQATCRLKDRCTKDLVWKKQRRLFEFLTKSDEHGSQLSTQMTMHLGELEVLVIQPFSSQRYLEQRLLLPAIVQKFTRTSDEQMPYASIVAHVGVDQQQSPPQTPTDVTSSSIMSRPLSLASTSSLVSDRASVIKREDGALLLHNSEAHMPIMNTLPLPGIALPKPGGQGSDIASWITGFRSSALTLMGCKAPCPCSNRSELGVQWSPRSSPRTDDMVGTVNVVAQDWEHLSIPLRPRAEEPVESGRVCASIAVVSSDSLGLIGLTERAFAKDILQKVSAKDVCQESISPIGKKYPKKASLPA